MMGPVRALRVPGGGDKSPIFIPGKGPAALCLHGFTGTPYEVAPLARALAAAGFAVSAPLLAGHGDSPAALEKNVKKTASTLCQIGMSKQTDESQASATSETNCPQKNQAMGASRQAFSILSSQNGLGIMQA